MCQDYESPKKRERETKNATRQQEVKARKVALQIEEEAKRAAVQKEAEARRAGERVNRVKKDWVDVSTWLANAKGGYSKKIGTEWLNIFIT